jgi:serine/threonine protein kinase
MNHFHERESQIKRGKLMIVKQRIGNGSSASVDVFKRVFVGSPSRSLLAIKRYYREALVRKRCVVYSRGGNISFKTGEDNLLGEIAILQILAGECDNVIRIEDVIHDDRCITVLTSYSGAPIMTFQEHTNAYCARSLDPVRGSLFSNTIREFIDVFNEDDAVAYLRQILNGMSFLREKCVVHKDIKPENILINYPVCRWRRFKGTDLVDMSSSWSHDRPIHVTICDFDTAELAPDGRIFDAQGTVLFSPPEVFNFIDREEGVDGYARDAWSVGMVAYCMLAGYHPVPVCSSSLEFQLSLLKLQQEGGQISLPANLVEKTVLREVVEGLLHVDPGTRLSVRDARSILTV